jgi:predicted molibdopterin-dependent oxidoreductase YjgC
VTQLRATAGIERSEEVAFFFDGRRIVGHAGESIAAALLANGVRVLRASQRGAEARGAFCLMGLCQECVVEIDGHVTESCRATVVADLRVTSRRPVATP